MEMFYHFRQWHSYELVQLFVTAKQMLDLDSLYTVHHCKFQVGKT